MRSKKVLLSAALLLSLGGVHLHAQESFNSSGNTIVGSNGSISYSVGQSFYTTNTGTDGYLIQGVQQPFEISVINSDNLTKVDLLISTYPNPTTDFLILKFDELPNNSIYQLYGINGDLLKSDKLENQETLINVVDLNNSIYLLKVSINNKPVKTFKIIKN
jgi:hypothetical protein